MSLKLSFFLVAQKLIKPIIAKKLRRCEVYLRSYTVIKSHILFFDHKI